jgi:GNAT superfamily N-acetyltransferase
MTHPQFDGPRSLQPEEHSSAITLLNAVLRPDGPASILQEYPLVLGTENIQNMFVMVKGNEVVSHAAIYFSRLLSGRLVFKVGGIGSVATHPDYRGKGLASAVINHCIDVMEEAGCHLSVLWTQRHDFYRNLGFETAGSEYLYRIKPAQLAKDRSSCEVVPFSFRHLPAIIDIHDRERMRTERTRGEWEAYLGLPKAKALVAMRDDEATAYAVMGKGEDFQRCVLEWGGDVGDLLCIMRAFGAAIGGEFMVLVPAHRSGFTQRLEQMRFPRLFEYLAMMRIMNVKSVSSLIRDHVREQVGTNFQLCEDEAGLKIGIEREEIIVPERRMLARILFGPNPVSNLPGGLPRKTAAAIDKVFPIPLFIWGLDSV